MPARANIVINDATSPTPVAHTFNPTENGEWSLFEDKVGGIPIGFGLITMRMKRPTPPSNGTESKASSRVYRQELNIALPVLEVTSPSTGTGIQPAPTVAYILRCNMLFLWPERSTLQERKNVVAYAKNVLSDANVLKVLQDLEDWY